MLVLLPILVVDKVAKARGVNNVELQANTVLLNISAEDLDADSLWALLGERSVLLGGVQGGVEQSVDKSRFAESRFTYKFDRKAGD